MGCPVKNTNDYKRLVSQMGSEASALYVWKYFGENYPPSKLFKTTSELKKEMRITNTIEARDLKRVMGEVFKYNNRNNTSHWFKKEFVSGNKYNLELVVSYLPRTTIKNQVEIFDKNSWDKGNLNEKASNDIIKEEVSEEDNYENFRPEGFFDNDKSLKEQDRKDFEGVYEKLAAQKQKLFNFGKDSQEDYEEKKTALQKSLDVDVIMDSTIEYSQVDAAEVGKKATIRINPEKLFKDTVIHEFGHVYIDLLGGIKNGFVQLGVKQLQNSDLRKQVIAKYPELAGEALDKEVLATAVGQEGAKLFAQEKEQSAWQRFITRFFNKIKSLIGIEPNVAKELARQLLQNKVEKNLTGVLSEYAQLQKVEEESLEKELNRQEKLVEDAIGVIKKKIAKYSKTSVSDTYIKSLKALVEDMAMLESEHALLRFINVADSQTNTMLSRIKSGEKLSIKDLRHIKVYTDSFNIIDEVKLAALADSQLKNFLKKSKGFAKINKIQDRYKQITESYESQALELFAEQHSNGAGRIFSIKADEYAQEFDTNNATLRKGSTTKEYSEKRKFYVQEMLVKNKEAIQDLQKNYIMNLLRVAPKNLGVVDMWLVDGRSTNDDIVQIVVEVLDRADFETRQEVIGMQNDMTDVYEDFIKEVGNKDNMEELYSEMLQDEGTLDEEGTFILTGKKTNYMVSEYYQGLSKNIKIKNPQYEKIIAKVENESATGKMYNALVALAKKKDEFLPEGFKLGLKLPSINKTSTERFEERGIFTTLKEGITDKFKIKSDDTQFGQLQDTVEVIVDENNEERKSVPVYFRGNLALKEQSFDLMSIMLLDFATSSNFKNKTAILAEIDLVKDMMSTRKVTQRDSTGKIKIDKILGKTLLRGGEDNAYKSLESLIEDRVYGIKTLGNPTVSKVAGAIMGWTGDVALIGNWMAGSSNLIYGKISNYIASIGGTNYSKNDWVSGEKEYMKDFMNVIDDIGSKRYKSMTNLLLEKFDGMQDFSAVRTKFADNNKFKALFKKDSLHAISHMSEHYIQGSMLWSIMKSEKLQIGSKTITLDQAYEVKNNRLAVKEEYKDYITQDLEARIGRKVKKIGRELHGNYDANNQPMLQRYVVGKMAMMLRKWVVPGAKRRYRGLSNSLKTKEQLLEMEKKSPGSSKYYSQESGEFEEGMYVTSIRFVSTLVQDLKKYKYLALSDNWKKLSDQERANINKTIAEITIMVLAIVAGAVLKNLAGDDDDEDKNKAALAGAYLMRRLYGEMRFYTSVSEFLKIMRTPAASVNMIEKLVALITQAFSGPLEEYTNGNRKGTLKIKKDFYDVIPLLPQLDRRIEESLNFTYK